MNEIVPHKHGTAQDDMALPSPVTPDTPSALSPGSNLTAQEQIVRERVQRKAGIIRDMAFSTAMAVAIPVAKEIGVAAFRVYRDGLLREAGSPTDPVEIMLLEQLSLAHHRVAQLHAEAATAKCIEAVKVYSTAAARLTGETRRLALALKQYRDPGGKKQFTVVRQQNVSTGSQQVAYLDHGSPPQGQIPFNNVGSKQGNKRLEHATQTAFVPESQAASSRPPEPAIARSVDPPRSPAVAADRDQEPTLEALDGAADRGGQGPGRGERSLAAEG